jgi:hypothetical protein
MEDGLSSAMVLCGLPGALTTNLMRLLMLVALPGMHMGRSSYTERTARSKGAIALLGMTHFLPAIRSRAIMAVGNFDRNVFVNCPFDADYVSLLRPLLFTLFYLGYNPRIATERADSGEPRIAKIIQLIQESKFGIHDLSRIRSQKAGELFRLNMPFELGLDYGCKIYRGGRWKQKRCLILETERYRYQAAISDLSNSDIKEHDDRPDKIVRQVRNWLVQEDLKNGPSPTTIWYKFNDFMADLFDKLTKQNFSQEDIENLPITELSAHMKAWIENVQK